MKKKIIVIILCAGEGIRLKEITKNIPKTLIKFKELNNVSILEYLINTLIELEIHKIAIVKGHLGSKIDEAISSIKNKYSILKKKLVLVDSGNQYKLGPLYSFLSITTDKNLFRKKSLYMIIPGDTIFQFNLLNQIFSHIINNLNQIQKSTLIFYREIKVSDLKKQKESKTITIADIEKKGFKWFLKGFKLKDLHDLSDSNLICQIIPVFIFSFNFIKIIVDFEKKISVNTIREIINHILKKGKEIIAIKIEKEYNFYDIDNETDLIRFKSLFLKKKRGQ